MRPIEETPAWLESLKEETEVIEYSPVSMKPPEIRAWHKATPLYLNGEVAGFFNDSLEDDFIYTADKLPVEFFNHEVMDYGAKDEIKDAQRIVERFGVPYGDGEEIRDFYRALFLGRIELPPPAARIVEEKRKEHIARCEKLDGALYMLDGWKILYFINGLKDYVCPYVEVSEVMLEMQEIIFAVMAYISKRGASGARPGFKDFYSGVSVSETVLTEAMRTINNAASYPRAALTFNDKVDGYLFGYTFGGDRVHKDALTNATLYQFLETASDPAPWRRCPKCGRLFKYRIDHLDRWKKKGHKDSAYCSKRCADAGRLSAWRAGVRANSCK